MKQLLDACRANSVTDFIVVHEHRGQPNAIIISHLPYGPTGDSLLQLVICRDASRYPWHWDHVWTVSTSCISQHENSVGSASHERHHTYKKGEAGKGIELKEVGPRFQLRSKLFPVSCIHISRLTVCFVFSIWFDVGNHLADAADTEWVYSHYMNTTKKRWFVTDDDGWKLWSTLIYSLTHEKNTRGENELTRS